MKTFKLFLSEGSTKHISVFHPTRGVYKVNKHSDDHHVVHNKFGEPTHNFYNMSTKEVLDTLHKNHKMFSISDVKDLGESLQEELISELTDSKSSTINVHRGGYNEARFAFHLKGGHIDDDHKKLIEKHGAALDAYDKQNGTNERTIQEERAHAQARSFIQHARHLGYHKITQVHLTQREGDIEKKTGIKASQQENASDVIANFANKPSHAQHGFLGSSLKSSKQNKIGFHNGGLGAIGKTLGVDLESIAKKRQDEFKKSKGLPSKNAEAHRAIKGEKDTIHYRNNPLYDEASKHATTIHREVRDALHSHLSGISTEDAKNHLLTTYIKASHSHAIPFLKTHGQGGGNKPAKAHTEDPSDNDMYHSIAGAKKIEFHKGGEGNINVHADGKKVMSLQVKHNNGPLTSLKVGAV
jgi:hypothetical protein